MSTTDPPMATARVIDEQVYSPEGGHRRFYHPIDFGLERHVGDAELHDAAIVEDSPLSPFYIMLVDIG